jgi:hypothetical protein
MIDRLIMRNIAPQMGGWGVRKTRVEGKPNCITQHFELLLSSSKVK